MEYTLQEYLDKYDPHECPLVSPRIYASAADVNRSTVYNALKNDKLDYIEIKMYNPITQGYYKKKLMILNDCSKEYTFSSRTNYGLIPEEERVRRQIPTPPPPNYPS